MTASNANIHRSGFTAMIDLKLHRLSGQPKGLLVRDPDYVSDYLSKNQLSEDMDHPSKFPPSVDTDPSKYQPFRVESQKDEKSPIDNKMERRMYGFLSAEDCPDGQLTVGAIWRGFKTKTSAHGVPNYTTAKGTVKRVFWGLIVVVASVVLVYNFVMITKSFFSYQTDFSISLEHKPSLVFPAVTLCNINPVKRSLVSAILNRRKRSTGPCDPGWTEYDNICYSVSSYKANYSSARQACQTTGAELSIVPNDNVSSFIDTITETEKSKHYWIGLFYNSSWQWLDGTALTYTNWLSGEPTGLDPCGKVSNGMRWKDAKCDKDNHFICQKQITTTTSGVTYQGPTTTSADSASLSAQSTVAPSAVPNVTQSQTEVPTPDHTTPSPETSTHGDASYKKVCCCTCCSSNPLYIYNPLCGTCGRTAITDASVCAAGRIPQLTTTTTTTTTTPSTTTTTTTSTTTTTTTKTTTTPPTTTTSQEPREAFNEEEKLIEKLAHLGEEERTELGFSLEDIVLDCRYSGFDCTHQAYFKKIINPVHGNCYVFNSGWPGSIQLQKANHTGRRHGLHLTLNLQQNEYLDSTCDTAGIRLTVHPQERMPFPEDEGVTIAPGHSTSVGIKQVLMKRLSEPYGDCINQTKDHSDINLYEEMYPVHYSAQACQKTCYQKHMVAQCGCADAYFPTTGAAISQQNVTICDVTNSQQADCKMDIEARVRSNTLQCSCPDSCDSTVYNLQQSVGMWPAEAKRDIVIASLKDKIGNSFDVTDPIAVTQNLAKLEIYFEEFNFEIIKEKPKYGSTSYLSDIGGVFGLWLGFSVYTLAEFIEVFLDLTVFISLSCMICKTRPRVPEKTPVH